MTNSKKRRSSTSPLGWEEKSDIERLQADPEQYGREMAESFRAEFRETLEKWVRENVDTEEGKGSTQAQE